MPGSVVEALQQPQRAQHASHRWNAPVYGQRIQYTKEPDKSERLNPKEKRLIWSIVEKFLYYGWSIETPTLVSLNQIGTQQGEPTENTLKEAQWLMDFLSHHPNGKICYFAGNMQLSVDSDAVYMVVPGAKRQYAGHYYLQLHPHWLNYNKAPNNAAIHTECKLLKNIVCSAAEAECDGFFHNAQKATGIRRTL